ncbi:hypothetical protein CLLU_35680 [Clostridium luticellarii]|uniref:Uncharacterized protein n=1 Tax=Clostridium luticellarii TaxID=1691940 RepID=A0A2T0B5E5_9CLOT|nr:hypothetical protein CLLU_35680 [Clostridium luticellarii]
MRRNIVEKASSFKEIVFPIFTNGTLFDEDYMNLFDKNRNLVPIVSIEGNVHHLFSTFSGSSYFSPKVSTVTFFIF